MGNDNKPTLVGGSCIIACICVGAGMLGLPAAGSGAWTFWSILALAGVMVIMVLSGCLLLEALKSYPIRSSFSTVTKDLLGHRVAWVNNLAVYFVGAILLYAYTTSSGLILQEYIKVNAQVSSVLFVLLFSAFVWYSTRLVDRASFVLLIFMIFTFSFSVSGLVSGIRVDSLYGKFDIGQTKYLLSFLPIALTAFGFHHAVSSMRDYYLDEYSSQKAIVGGAIIAFVVYAVWIVSIYGNIDRGSFVDINAAGGNVDSLLAAIDERVVDNTLSIVIGAFSAAAILSSFIGVGLGVFDFIADAFQFSADRVGRTKTWAVTFLPPLLFSLFFPFGFISSIGYASLFAAIWACIIPVLLVRKVRTEQVTTPITNNQYHHTWQPSQYRCFGGSLSLLLVFVFGVTIILIHLFDLINLIPKFGF